MNIIDANKGKAKYDNPNLIKQNMDYNSTHKITKSQLP